MEAYCFLALYMIETLLFKCLAILVFFYSMVLQNFHLFEFSFLTPSAVITTISNFSRTNVQIAIDIAAVIGTSIFPITRQIQIDIAELAHRRMTHRLGIGHPADEGGRSAESALEHSAHVEASGSIGLAEARAGDGRRVDAEAVAALGGALGPARLPELCRCNTYRECTIRTLLKA